MFSPISPQQMLLDAIKAKQQKLGISALKVVQHFDSIRNEIVSMLPDSTETQQSCLMPIIETLNEQVESIHTGYKIEIAAYEDSTKLLP